MALVGLISWVTLSFTDLLLLFLPDEPVSAWRTLPRRLSNGDENSIAINVESGYPVTITAEVIDELPAEFQKRDFSVISTLDPGSSSELTYSLRPVQRGEYHFGFIRIFCTSFLGLLKRRITTGKPADVAVYPSFIQMRAFELYAINDRLTEAGIKKIRRIGHTMEFDQIREYVPGNDVRSINWKATARSGSLKVNQYQDQRSQQLINVIDLGRVMKMPFEGLTLLDYAINTSLIMSNIAMLKEDRAGVLTFSNNKIRYSGCERKRTHLQRIQELLYNTNTNFLESDFERLVMGLHRQIKQRSLILLYTNFETLDAMERQAPYLKKIARDHMLILIFFRNTEVQELRDLPSSSVLDIYTKAIVEQFDLEKQQIIRELNQLGIQTILTAPKELSVNAINKYLELKARGLV